MAASYRIQKAGYPDAPDRLPLINDRCDYLSERGLHPQSGLRRSAGSYWLRRTLAAGTMTAVCGLRWPNSLPRHSSRNPSLAAGAHVQGVAARTRSLAPVLGADADLLEAAAWLHDIGYAPGPALTGLHQLDGARYLRDAQHADFVLCRLVAHHSCAIVEAAERGLADVLSREFEPAPDALANVLTCCDMTTSPDGELVSAEQRLAEIHDRYGPGHLVSRSIQRATPMILYAVEQVHHRAAQTT
jgi:hypothetical protein